MKTPMMKNYFASQVDLLPWLGGGGRRKTKKNSEHCTRSEMVTNKYIVSDNVNGRKLNHCMSEYLENMLGYKI